MTDPEFPTFERKLIAEISHVDRQIASLQQQRDALERVLFEARKRHLGDRELTRKNSMRRILAESAILERLQRSQRPVGSQELLIVAAGVVPGLRVATFRSYLHRLKERGLIESPVYGQWKLSSTYVAPPSPPPPPPPPGWKI